MWKGNRFLKTFISGDKIQAYNHGYTPIIIRQSPPDTNRFSCERVHNQISILVNMDVFRNCCMIRESVFSGEPFTGFRRQ